MSCGTRTGVEVEAEVKTSQGRAHFGDLSPRTYSEAASKERIAVLYSG